MARQQWLDPGNHQQLSDSQKHIHDAGRYRSAPKHTKRSMLCATSRSASNPPARIAKPGRAGRAAWSGGALDRRRKIYDDQEKKQRCFGIPRRYRDRRPPGSGKGRNHIRTAVYVFPVSPIAGARRLPIPSPLRSDRASGILSARLVADAYSR